MAAKHNRAVYLSGFYWIFVAYLFLPLLLMILMSFKDANFIAFPINDWTLDWYVRVLQDRQVLQAGFYSLIIALTSTLSATILGVWIGLFLVHKRLRFKLLFFALACLPAVVPGIVSAISMRIFVSGLQIQPGTFAIMLGHTIHGVPFVVIMVLTRLRTMPVNLIDAAKDLGADNFMAFWRITLPFLKPALLGGMIFCMLISFDDFVRSFFLGGYKPTLPMLIFAKVQSGMSPEINTIATLILIITVSVGLYTEVLMRRSGIKRG